jgi:hypothetical protein
MVQVLPETKCDQILTIKEEVPSNN